MCFISISFKFSLFDFYYSAETLNLFVVALLVVLVLVLMRDFQRYFGTTEGDEGFENNRLCYKKPVQVENEGSLLKSRNELSETGE